MHVKLLDFEKLGTNSMSYSVKRSHAQSHEQGVRCRLETKDSDVSCFAAQDING